MMEDDSFNFYPQWMNTFVRLIIGMFLYDDFILHSADEIWAR